MTDTVNPDDRTPVVRDEMYEIATAIEAEAVAAERKRIAAAVEGLEEGYYSDDWAPQVNHSAGWDAALDAVLALLRDAP